MSNNKKYKYVKFEKLSDAIKAFEDGHEIYFRESVYGAWLAKGEHDGFFPRSEYYRREEVKSRTFYAWEHRETGYIKSITQNEAEVMPKEWRRIKLIEVLDD